MDGSRSHGAHPRRRDRARAAPARPLQRLQRPRRDRRRPRARRRRRERIAARPRRDARRLRPGRDDRGRRRAGLDPADQEPRRRQRGAAHAAARGRRASGSTSGSPSTTGSPTAATSPGSGTPTSSCWPDARAPGRLRRHPGAGDGAAAEVRRLARGARSRSCRRSRPRSTDAVAAAPGAALRPPHLHRPARAAQAARRPRPGARSSGDEPQRGDDLARRRVRRLRTPTCRSGRSWPSAADGPVLELGCGTGRVALHLARRGTPSGRPRPRRRAGRRRCGARAAGLPVERRCRRRPRLRARASESPWSLAPMQLLQLLAERRRARSSASRCVAAALRPGGRLAAAIVEGMPRARRRRAARCPTCARSTAGSTRACRCRGRRSARRDRRPPPAPDRLPRRRPERGAERGPDRAPSAPRRSRRRRRAVA